MKMTILVFCLVLLTVTVCAESPEETGMQFIQIGWANEVLGYNDYVLNEDGVFRRGERAYAYLEVEGYATSQEGEYTVTDIAVDVALRASFGLRLFYQQDLIDYRQLHQTAPDTLWFYIWVDIPTLAPSATYIAEVIIRDRISGEILKHQERVVVR